MSLALVRNNFEREVSFTEMASQISYDRRSVPSLRKKLINATAYVPRPQHTIESYFVTGKQSTMHGASENQRIS